MLKKRERLTRAQFNEYFSSGRRIHSPSLTIIHVPHSQFSGAVVVGKKVHKKAVDRNRLRRRVYNQLYQQKLKHDLVGVYICIVKPAAKELSSDGLGQEMEGLLARIKKAR